MFDDFTAMQQIDEIVPEEYDDWCRWMYDNAFHEEPAEA